MWIYSEVILYLKTELSHKNEQLTTLIKSLNTNVEVGSKHDKLDIETMLENIQHQFNGTRNMECTNDRSMQHKVIINNKPSTCNEPTQSHFTLKDNHINQYTDESLDGNELIENTSDIVDFQLDNKWITSRKKKGSNLIADISLHNEFTPLSFQHVDINDENESCDENDENHDEIMSTINNPINVNKRPSIITQLNPEKNIMSHMRVNSKHTNITKKEGKVFIISDSITKPIDMLEFNNHLKNRDAVKRAFPRATASPCPCIINWR